MKKIFVFGTSGHSKVVIDILERIGNQKVAALVDDDSALWGKTFFDYSIVGGRRCFLDGIISRDTMGIVAIGDNRTRLSVADWLIGNGFSLSSAIHPHAQVGRDVHIGAGAVVMAGAIINPGAWIGDNVVINTGATIDHDCMIERGVHVAPGCNVCGGVSVGEGSLVGTGSAIIPGVEIGKYVTVGAGSTIIDPIHDGKTVVGSPGRIVR